MSTKNEMVDRIIDVVLAIPMEGWKKTGYAPYEFCTTKLNGITIDLRNGGNLYADSKLIVERKDAERWKKTSSLEHRIYRFFEQYAATKAAIEIQSVFDCLVQSQQAKYSQREQELINFLESVPLDKWYVDHFNNRVCLRVDYNQIVYFGHTGISLNSHELISGNKFDHEGCPIITDERLLTLLNKIRSHHELAFLQIRTKNIAEFISMDKPLLK